MRGDTTVVSPLAERAAGAQEAGARIAAMLPAHTHYVQLQSGGLEVLLHKAPSQTETINDTDHGIVTFWRVLRDRPDELRRACSLTPLSRAEFDLARGSGCHSPGTGELEVARRVWVLLSQSADGPARLRPQWRGPRRRRAHPGTDPEVEQMETLAQRLKDVTLECLPPVKVVESLGRRGVCFYADLRTDLFGAQGADPGAALRPGPAAVVAALAKTKATVVARTDQTVDMTPPTGWVLARLEAQTGPPVMLWSNRPLSVQQPLFDVESGPTDQAVP